MACIKTRGPKNARRYYVNSLSSETSACSSYPPCRCDTFAAPPGAL